MGSDEAWSPGGAWLSELMEFAQDPGSRGIVGLPVKRQQAFHSKYCFNLLREKIIGSYVHELSYCHSIDLMSIFVKTQEPFS